MSTFRPLTLLHISDIQVQGSHEEKMLSSLRSDLRNLTALYGLNPQLIVASGDLAQYAKNAEFNRVSEFLKNTAKQLELTVNDVVMVPGNHDISWDACMKIFENSMVDHMPPYRDKWDNYIDFFTKFYADNSVQKFSFTRERPWTLFEFPKIKTVIAGFNSTWEESHLKEHHHGCIGHDQINWFSEKLREYKNREWLRIAVLHHNPVISSEKDDSFLKDRLEFTDAISPLVNLILHGHTHESKEDNINGVPVLSTGSASVPEAARGKEVPNQYQIIQIWPHYYQKWARSYSLSRRTWIGDCSISRFGTSWKERKSHIFRRVSAAYPTREEQFSQRAKGFIEVGDTVTASAILSDGLYQIPDDDLLDYFSLRQKFGAYNKDDLKVLDEKIANIASKNKEKALDLQVLRVKLYSQEEEFIEADNLFEELILSKLKPRKQRGIIHRHAVSKAISEGFEVAKPIFHRAQEISNGTEALLQSGAKNKHSLITTEVLQTVAEFFCSPTVSEKDLIVSVLMEAQIGYLAADYAYGIGQAFPEKSAIQTLFAEAAVLLFDDLENFKGWSRLFAANLLVSRLAIRPNAEGYSEQLSMIYVPRVHYAARKTSNIRHRKELHKILKAAMHSDSEERKKFLNLSLADEGRRRILMPMSEVLELIPPQNPRPSDWLAFREFIDEIDQISANRI